MHEMFERHLLGHPLYLERRRLLLEGNNGLHAVFFLQGVDHGGPLIYSLFPKSDETGRVLTHIADPEIAGIHVGLRLKYLDCANVGVYDKKTERQIKKCEAERGPSVIRTRDINGDLSDNLAEVTLYSSLGLAESLVRMRRKNDPNYRPHPGVIREK